VPRLNRRLARLEARDSAGAARATAWLARLAPIVAKAPGEPDGFPPALARVLAEELVAPRRRGQALAFLDALATFGRNDADRAVGS
jgi:hypothetical protein